MERIINISMRGRIIKSLFLVVGICMNVIFASAQTNRHYISSGESSISSSYTRSTSEFQPGDADGNNLIDANDINEIVRIIMGGSTTYTQKKAADFNNDGIVNVADIVNFLNTTLRIKTGEVLSLNVDRAEICGYLTSHDIEYDEFGIRTSYTGQDDDWIYSPISNWRSADANGRFSTLCSFEDHETIYYQAYLKKNWNYEFGEIKIVHKPEFNVTVHTGSPISGNQIFVEVKGIIEGTVEGGFDYYGFEYNLTGPDDMMTRCWPSDNLANGEFTGKLFFWDDSDIVYYQAFVSKDGAYRYGEVKSVDRRDIGPNVEASLERVWTNRVVLNGNVGPDYSILDSWGIEVSTSPTFNAYGGWMHQSDFTINVDSKRVNNIQGDFTIEIKYLKHNTTYYYRTYANKLQANNTIKRFHGETHSFTTLDATREQSGEAIDLGLSVKWANCDLGSQLPEIPGKQFSWAEVSPAYNNVNFTFDKNGGSPFVMSDISATDYDAAHVIWGGSWRMPTREEWSELFSKCTVEWIDSVYLYQGRQEKIKGLKITGPNKKSIFLPKNKYYGMGTYGSAGSSLSWGNWESHSLFYYWSSTSTKGMLDNADAVRGGGGFNNVDTEFGFCIRPVSD